MRRQPHMPAAMCLCLFVVAGMIPVTCIRLLGASRVSSHALNLHVVRALHGLLELSARHDESVMSLSFWQCSVTNANLGWC